MFLGPYKDRKNGRTARMNKIMIAERPSSSFTRAYSAQGADIGSGARRARANVVPVDVTAAFFGDLNEHPGCATQSAIWDLPAFVVFGDSLPSPLFGWRLRCSARG